jgi:hypothetical protein
MEIWGLFLSPSLLLTSSGPPSVVGFESRCPSLSLPLSLLSLSLSLLLCSREIRSRRTHRLPSVHFGHRCCGRKNRPAAARSDFDGAGPT